MTATITTIQNGILGALTTLAGQSPPVPFTPRIAEADVSGPPDPTTADVTIGFEASARLGRTASTILEQILVPVTIARRYPVQDQSALNANHALAELIHDTLADYHTSTARVEHLLTPHPLDLPQAVGPGIYSHKFILDMDVLRNVAAITQDVTTPTKTLTAVRTAAWDALDNWSEFTSVWGRTFRTDADLNELALHDPASFELPALAITWGPTAPRFLANIAQDWPATINVVAWFPAHQVTLAEYRVWQIVRAIYQSAPSASPTVSYIRAATGRIPEKDSPISIEPVELGRSQQLKAVKVTCQFVITGIVSPLTD